MTTVIVYTYIKPDRFVGHLNELREFLHRFGRTKIQKIPLKPEDWSRLEELAARLSRQGVSATAGQLASVMVHRQLKLLGSSPARPARAARRPTGRSTPSRSAFNS